MFLQLVVRLTIVGVLAAGPAGASAQARSPATDTPYLLVLPVFGVDTVLARSLVDSVRVSIERRLPRRELYVLPRAVVEGSLMQEPYLLPQDLADVRQLARQLRADIILRLSVARTDRGLRVSPTLIRGRGTPVNLAAITAGTLGRAAARVADVFVKDSTLRRGRR